MIGSATGSGGRPSMSSKRFRGSQGRWTGPRAVYHSPERLDLRILRPGQPPVELRQDHVDDPLRLDLITREEVGRGLYEGTLAVDHGGVFLVADRQHDSPHADANSCEPG